MFFLVKRKPYFKNELVLDTQNKKNIINTVITDPYRIEL